MMMVVMIFLTFEYIKPIILKLNLQRTELWHRKEKSVLLVKNDSIQAFQFQVV